MNTIYALSSGKPPSGVAVFRVSGPQSRFVLETISGLVPSPRMATLRKLRFPDSSEIVDTGLCFWFPGPESFTGEDSAEFHLHGGPAVVQAMLKALSDIDGLRLAEAGEFSRRAFENGKLDLTEVEGLADLIVAETEMQRRQAVAQAGGVMREQLENWRERIVRMRAMVEASFDFAEEEDIPGGVEDGVWAQAAELAREIKAALDNGRHGEIVRDGFQIVLLGSPNAGKSSLLNALARRDVAIVTSEAGTTRDLIEVHLDIDGYAVTIVDTAGMRETEGQVENEGIRRAKERAGLADLVLWLWPAAEEELPAEAEPYLKDGLLLRSKDDEGVFGDDGVSVVRENGMEALLEAIRSRLDKHANHGEFALITRGRHRSLLQDCTKSLDEASSDHTLAIEIRSEKLRESGDLIGRLTGRIETDHLLDVIFKEFCVGK